MRSVCEVCGNEHHVTNLKLYVREHPEAFHNPVGAYSMFVRQSGCLRNGRLQTTDKPQLTA